MVKVNKAIEDITKSVDDNIYSAEEQDKEITERLRIDNTSKFIFPHLVRPVTFGWALLVLTVTNLISVFLAFKYMEGSELMTTVVGISATWSGLVGMMAKFYFQSRGNEKIEFKKAQVEEKKIKAAIEIEKVKAKAVLEKEKVLLKEEVKNNKEERKAEKRANRKPLFGRKNSRK